MAATVRHAAARRQGQQASAAGEADNPGESAFLSVRNSIPAGVDAASSSSGPPSGSSRSDTSALPHREKGQNGLLIAPGLQYGIERHPLARGDSPLPEIPPSSEGIRSKWRAYFRQGTFFEDENFPENVFLTTMRMGTPYLTALNKAKSLHLFSVDGKFRRAMIRLTTNEFFDYFIILTILINCVFLAANSTFQSQELLFSSIFTLEMIFKVIAFGFIHHKLSYLRSPWNILDFVVVMSGWLLFIPGIVDLSTLRAFRVLRVLRTINALPGLRIMVTSVLQSLRALGDVFLLMLFFLFVSSVLGLQLFSGSLLHKCVRLPSNSTCSLMSSRFDNGNIEFANNLSMAYRQNSSNWIMEDGSPVICGNASSATSCPASSICLPDIGRNPNYGYTSFDHFGYAFLTSIQLFTLDFWEDVYIKIISAAGAPAFIFFYFVVFGGAFYTLNLVLAVVSMSYNKASNGDKEEMEDVSEAQKIRKFRRHGDNQELTDAAEAAYDKKMAANQTIYETEESAEQDDANSPTSASEPPKRSSLKPIDETASLSLSPTLLLTTGPCSAGSLPKQQTLGVSKLALDPPRPPMAPDPPRPPMGLDAPQPPMGSDPPQPPMGLDPPRPPMGLDPQRPPMTKSPGPPRRRASAPAFSSLGAPRVVLDPSTKDLFKESRPSPRPPTLQIQPTPPGPSTSTAKKAVEAASESSNPAEDRTNTGAAPPNTQITVTSLPSPASLDVLPPIQSNSPLPNVQARSHDRTLPGRALSLPEAPQATSPHQLPPLRVPLPSLAVPDVENNRVINSAPVPPIELPGKVTSTEASDQITTPDSGQGDELTPLVVKRGEPRPSVVRDANDEEEKPQPRPLSSSSASGHPLRQLHHSTSSPAGISLFTTRQTSTLSNRSSLSNSLLDFEHRPMPLPPTVFVEDEEHNVVEAVRITHSQRILHHLDTVWWPLAKRAAQFVRSGKFEAFIITCIMLNTIVLSIEHPFMDSRLELALCVANLVFGVVFLLEVILKMLALGIRRYFRFAWNVFDFLIVLFSIVELVLMLTGKGICHSETSNIATVFRAFRLLRILKLAQSWTTMRSLFAIIGSSIKDLGYLTLVMVLVTVTFALIGMNLFRTYYTAERFAPDDMPRWNFTDFAHSLMLIFRILCGEWIEPLYDTMRVTNESASIFYLLVLAVGNFLILNLFLALLLNSFDVENLRQEKEDDGKKKVPFLKRIKRLARRIFCCRRRIAPRDGRRKSRRSVKSRQVAGKHSWESTELTKPVEASKKEVTDRRISDTLDAMRSLNVSKALPATTGNTAGTPIPVRRRGISESSTTTFDLPTPGDKRSSPQVGARQRQTSESSIGVPTVLVTGTGQETDVPFQTVETRRTSIEETMVSTGTGQERHLSVTHTRIRSSSFTSTKSASNKSSNTNLLAIRHDDSQVSLSSRQNAAANSAAGVGPGLDGNCCTCVSNYQCGCLWCLCACCFSGHKAPTSPDDIEIVELTPQSKDYADDDLDDNKEDDTSLKDTVALAMSRCRAFLADVVTHSWFDNIILLLVVFSSISLAFEDSHLQACSARASILRQLTIIFTVLFTVEFLIKLFALGPARYFTNPWNWLDFLIVLISIGSIDYTGVSSANQLGVLRAIRTFRCLRPLRSISRWNGMKTVVNALLQSIPGISNVLLVCGIIWLIFSILGVQFFGGLFHKCEVDGVRISHINITNKSDCIMAYGEIAWVNSPQNFDNVVNAALSLFQVATFEGWIELMADAVDAKGIDQQPEYEYNIAAYTYFVVFIIVGSFFVLNLFIGVIIDSFNQVKKRHEDQPVFAQFLTPNQQAWIKTWRKMANTKPLKSTKLPTGRMHLCLYHIVVSQRFEVVIMSIIMLNAIVIATQHYTQSQIWTDIQTYVNVAFTLCYLVEAILKIYVWRKAYFYSGWNLFDLFVCILSIAGLVIDSLSLTIPIDPSLLRLVRLARIGRVLRLIRKAQGIRRLLFTLLYSLPALLNVGALLFLTIYIFSILGISLFGHVKHTGVLNDQINFSDFPHAFLVLFRIATAAGWNEVLYPLMISSPHCDPDYNDLPMGNCGHRIIAPIYLGAFVLMSYIIVVNLYIAIVLENFAETEEVGLAEADLEAFYEAWVRFDPGATQFIPFFNIQKLVRAVPRPLGIPMADLETIARLDIPLFKDEEQEMMVAHCLDVMDALVRRVLTKALGNIDDSSHITEIMQQTQEKFDEKFPNRSKSKPVSRSGEMVSATLALQKAVRRFLRTKRLRQQQQQVQQTIREEEEMEIDIVEVRHTASDNDSESQASSILIRASHSRVAVAEPVSPVRTPVNTTLLFPGNTLKVAGDSALTRSTTSLSRTPDTGHWLTVTPSKSSKSVNLVGRAAGILNQDYSTSTRELLSPRSSLPEDKDSLAEPRTRRQTCGEVPRPKTSGALPRRRQTDGELLLPQPHNVATEHSPPLTGNVRRARQRSSSFSGSEHMAQSKSSKSINSAGRASNIINQDYSTSTKELFKGRSSLPDQRAAVHPTSVRDLRRPRNEQATVIARSRSGDLQRSASLTDNSPLPDVAIN